MKSAADAHDFWRLVDLLCANEASPDEQARLEAWLLADAARQHDFVLYCQLDASVRLELRAQSAGRAAQQALAQLPNQPEGGSDRRAPRTPTYPMLTEVGRRGFLGSTVRSFLQTHGFAIFVAVAFTLNLITLLALWRTEGSPPLAASSPRPAPLVATLTSLQDVRWKGEDRALGVGDGFPAGRTLRLQSGLVEITFQSGAKLTLEGPATCVIREANAVMLDQGRLTAIAEGQAALGFAVHTPAAVITDRGTSFAVAASAHSAEVVVFSGRVDVHPRDSETRHTLAAGESLRIDSPAEDGNLSAETLANAPNALRPTEPARVARGALTPLLRLDFQHSAQGQAGVTQAGFEACDETHAAQSVWPTPAGKIHLTIAGHDTLHGGRFNRPGLPAGWKAPLGDLYQDFLFKNGSSGQTLTLTLSGQGIRSQGDYWLTFHSYDSDATQGEHLVTATGVAGTRGQTAAIAWRGGTAPVGEYALSTKGRFTADARGVLTIKLSDTYHAARSGVRLNGLELVTLTPVEEVADSRPSALPTTP